MPLHTQCSRPGCKSFQRTPGHRNIISSLVWALKGNEKDCSMPELTYSYLSAPCSGLRIELHTRPILGLAWPSLLLTWL